MTDVGIGMIAAGAGIAIVAVVIALLAYKLSDAKDEVMAAQAKQLIAERDLAIVNFKLNQVEAEFGRETAIEKAQDKEIGDAIDKKPNADLAADDVDQRIRRLFTAWRASPPTTPADHPASAGAVPPTSTATKA